MPSIKTVAVAGGTGELGNAIVSALLKAGYPITILSRTPGKLPAELSTHSSLKEVTVDYNTPDSLESALRGHDAVVSTLGNNTLDAQKALFLAAEKADVTRFLPSEFGSDLDKPVTRALPIFGAKVALQDFIKERVAAGSKVTYTLVYCNAFLDWGLQKGFILDPAGHKATLYDGGDYPFSVTRLSAVGDAVVGVLRHPAETRNRVVRVNDGRVTGKTLVGWVKGASLGGAEWTVTEDSSEATAKRSTEALSKGVTDMWVWMGMLHRACFSEAGGAGFEETDNELLGVKTLSQAELKQVTEEIIRAIG